MISLINFVAYFMCISVMVKILKKPYDYKSNVRESIVASARFFAVASIILMYFFMMAKTLFDFIGG